MDIDDAIKTFLSVLPVDAVGPFQDMLSIEGAIKVVNNLISAGVDPSEITLDQVRLERKRCKMPSTANWKY